MTIEELEFLQSVVIVDNRFVMPGLRVEGGFVGAHERTTGMPMPVHISARSDDLDSFLSGLIDTYQMLGESDYDAVLMAALIAFGFIKNYIDMPDKLVDLLIRFLDQNGGKLSKRAREKEFSQLTETEVEAIERKRDEIFQDNE